MTRALLLVDVSYQIYRACAAHPMLSDGRDRYTGGIYGFLQSFCRAVNDSGATRAVLCRDSKPYLRSAEFPGYKQARKKDADPELRERYEATEAPLLALMSALGVPEWSVPGFEYDDLAAHAVRRHRARWPRIAAATNDSDLWQLFDAPGFSMVRGALDRDVTLDRDWLLRTHGLRPDEVPLALALQGTHNDVPGIAGIGPSRALQAVKDPARLRPLLERHGELVERNLRLIRLPHPEFPASEQVPGPGRPPGTRGVYRALAEYDIDCTLAMVSAFERLSGR